MKIQSKKQIIITKQTSYFEYKHIGLQNYDLLNGIEHFGKVIDLAHEVQYILLDVNRG